MKEYVKATIDSVIRKLNKNIFLPDIQRPFIWDEMQIYKLFDSLMRGYPISTFLFWVITKEDLTKIETENDTKIKMFKFVDKNVKEDDEEINRDKDDYSLVLDGQQRLTSLYISLKGTWVENYKKTKRTKELYLNVLSGEEENEDGILFEYQFHESLKGRVFTEKNDNGNLLEKIWVNVKTIYESDLNGNKKRKEFTNKIIDEIQIDYNHYFDKIDDNVSVLDDVLKKNLIVNYYPEEESSYERVLDIFVRTNSGGIKLSYSDLLFSKIKLQWNSAREKFKEVTDKICTNNFEFDNDFILKTCLVIYSQKSDEIRYKVTNLHPDLISSIIKDWNRITHSIYLSIDLLHNFFIEDKKLLPSYNALIPIIYWNYKNNKKSYKSDNSTDVNEIKIIRKWLISSW